MIFHARGAFCSQICGGPETRLGQISLLAPCTPLLGVPQKMQKMAIELLRVLQKSKMTYARQEQQSCIWDFLGHELGIVSIDRLVVVRVNNKDWYRNCPKFFRGKTWFCRPHMGNLVEEGFVAIRRWRELFIFRLCAGDELVKDRALGNVLDAGRVGIGGKGKEFR